MSWQVNSGATSASAPPPVLDAIPAPKTKDEEAAVRELAHQLRARFSDVYPAMADRVEAELGLRDVAVAGRDARIDRHVPL